MAYLKFNTAIWPCPFVMMCLFSWELLTRNLFVINLYLPYWVFVLLMVYNGASVCN